MLEQCERKILLGCRLLELPNRVMVATVLAAALLLQCCLLRLGI